MAAAARRGPAAVILVALAAFAGAGCDTQARCRPGTVFLHVDVGPFTTADAADISVSVDRAPPMTTSRPIPAGARTGGVEVVFPHGYPTGKSVDIQVTLKANGMPIATRTENLGALVAGCDVLDETFTGVDALTGAGGAGGSNGGTGGAAGEAGTSGGVAGTSGGSGGSGGSVAGTMGGGRGGTGGDGPCVATGAESCFNGRDDDCDDLTDCADPDCAPVAQCVPLDATGGRIGVMVSTLSSCPTGYTDQLILTSGLSAGPCTGCSCRPPGVTCTTNIYSFQSASDCNNVNNTGTYEITFTSPQPCTVPSWIGGNAGTIYGVQATSFLAPPTGSCAPQGTARPGSVTWASTMRFCAAPTVGAGCLGGVCVPVGSSPKCAMFDGPRACWTGTTSSSWNTGASDSRTCGACTCGNPTGASCSGMVLNVGADFACSTVSAAVSSGQRRCYSGTGVNSPGVIFSGTPTAPTCSASAPLSGTVMPTGSKTLCCM